jgi:cytochrome c biogenesis protein CcmG, thiol:disulfide interchange protein DsbE
MNRVYGAILSAIVIVVAAVSFSGCKSGSTTAGSSSGKAAPLAEEPNVSFKDLQGNSVSLASFKGKVVLVNFWGTWCEPCRGEIPILISMQQQYSPRGFTLLGVATNDDLSAVGPFVKNTQFQVDGRPMTMNYPIVMGTDEISTQFGGLLGMPTSFLISRDGKIVKRYIGAFPNGDQIRKDVEAQL